MGTNAKHIVVLSTSEIQILWQKEHKMYTKHAKEDVEMLIHVDFL